MPVTLRHSSTVWRLSVVSVLVTIFCTVGIVAGNDFPLFRLSHDGELRGHTEELHPPPVAADQQGVNELPLQVPTTNSPQLQRARQLLAQNPAFHQLNDRLMFSAFSGRNDIVCSLCLLQVVAAAEQLGNEQVQREVAQSLNSSQLSDTIEAVVNVTHSDPSLSNFFRGYYSAAAFPRCNRVEQKLRSTCQQHHQYITKHGQQMDFSRGGDALNQINAQVRAATGNKITQLFSHLSSDTQLVFAAATLFRAQWYSRMLTQPGRFRLGHSSSSGSSSGGEQWRDVTMIGMSESLAMLNSDRDQIVGVALPYRDPLPVQMFLFRTVDCNDDIRARLSQRHLFALNNESTKRYVQVQLPRFSIESKKSDYSDLLQQMGIYSMFSGGLGVYEKLKVDQVAHRAILQVDEHGTIAAGAAGIAIVPLIAPPQAVRIRFDCPFMAVLYHTSLDVPLFTAYIADPSVS